MQLIFLGTSSMVPTKTRNHSSFLLSYESEGILFDCGEGTQRQIKQAGIKPTKITRILLSHWHGDHVLGLPGLMQTLSGSEYEKTLHIYGPKGTNQRIKSMFETFVFDKHLDFKVHEIEDGVIYAGKRFSISCAKLKHGVVTFGFSFLEKDRRRIKMAVIDSIGIPEGPLLGKLQNGHTVTYKGKKVSPEEATYLVKGKKVVYIADTLPCDSAAKLAKDADVMICESTYTSKLEEKALEYHHMTSAQAAILANQANTKKLILTHFSQRYKDTSELLVDAKNYFDNVVAAEDFMKIKV